MAETDQIISVESSSRSITEEVYFKLPAEGVPAIPFRFGSHSPRYGKIRRALDHRGAYHTRLTLETERGQLMQTMDFFGREIEEELPTELSAAVLGLLKNPTIEDED